jgi:lipid A 4'-phosphatase
LALGPGMMINGIGKPGWQRPRPVQIDQFGGARQFVLVGDLGEVSRECRSFPSGHASMGFFLMAPAFLVWRRRVLAGGFMLLGIFAGLAIGVARMAQGAHFPSDVIWAGGIVYFTCVVLQRLILRDEYDGPRMPETEPLSATIALEHFARHPVLGKNQAAETDQEGAGPWRRSA